MKKGFIFKLTILSVALVPLETGNFVQSALSEIAEALKVGSVLSGYILTLPALASIIFSIICGKLSVTIDKKRLVLTGLALYIAGGAGGALVPNIYWILACRLIVGIGAGLTLPLVMGLITEFFEGNEKASMMGYSQAVGNFGGALGNIIAGYIALINWRLNFLLYLIFIVLFALILKFLPNMKPSLERINEKAEGKNKLTLGVFIFTLICFMFFILAMNLTINTIMFIPYANLGDTSHTGIALSLVYLFAFPAGIIFGKVYKLVKEQTFAITIFLNAIAAFLIANAQSMFFIYVANAIGGISVGFFLPSASVLISRLVSKLYHSFAFGVMWAGVNLGIFVAPLSIPVFFRIVGAENYSGLFNLIAASYVVVTAIAAIYVTMIQKRFIQDQ